MTDTTQDTQRTKVLNAILALFPTRDTDASAGFEAQYGLAFSVTSREPLGNLPTGKTSSLGIYASMTDRNPRFPHVEITLPVVIEIHVHKEQGVPLATSVERYLGVVERVVRENETLGGMIATIEVTGDNVDIDTPYEKQADGALYFSVKYFQQLNDPTRGR